MAESKIAEKVRSLVEEPIEKAGLSLWDVRFEKEGASWYLRVFIDSEKGVTLDDCTEVSRLIDPIIDEADPISKQYFLEVCSPGLNRRLTRPEHFRASVGRDVTVRLIHPLPDGRREFSGRLEGFGGDSFTLSTGQGSLNFEKQFVSFVKINDHLED